MPPKRAINLNIRFTEEDRKALQKLADKHTEGNVSMMVRKLIKEAIEKMEK